MANDAVPAMAAPPVERDNPFTRSPAGIVGAVIIFVMSIACLATIPFAFGSASTGKTKQVPRYQAQNLDATYLPPAWAPHDDLEQERRDLGIAATKTEQQAAPVGPPYALGADDLGRSLLVRCLAGGAVSLGIGLCAAIIATLIGTAYGITAAWAGGRVDAVMMRIVDILYGLPYILLAVLLVVAVDAIAMRFAQKGHEFSAAMNMAINFGTLLIAIGGVSWLTMARVVRGQTLSLKELPFIEAARAAGAPTRTIVLRHLLPNLVGPIVIYGALTAPQAVLQESFLSFLGIGVRPPLPSWGNLVAEGLKELNPVKTRWWLVVFPSLFLGVTLVGLNFLGEGLREAMDPKRARA